MMFSLFDICLLGGCACALLTWCLCIWFDKHITTTTLTTLQFYSTIIPQWLTLSSFMTKKITCLCANY